MNNNSIKCINELWDNIINSSNEIRSENKNLDGLKYWKHIKNIIKDINSVPNKNIEWNKDHIKIKTKFYNKFNLSEKDKNNNLIENNHFLLQLINIPYKDDNIPSFKRLIQIALNIGQLKSSLDSYSKEIRDFIKIHKLFKIDTYMNKKMYKNYIVCDVDILKVSDILISLNKNPPLVGGFREKYLKYKLKYLNLREK